MKKLLAASMVLITSAFTVNTFAAPGEYWEVTTKMEMPGMPFAMPATTQKVCVAKGAEKDPSHATKDKDCEMTDVKVSGNKTSWTVKCNRKGEMWTGNGEQTTTGNSYQGTMHMSGKSHGGRDMNMTTNYSGKHLGGSCDSEEMAKKAEEQGSKIKAEMCDTSKFQNTGEWINRSGIFLQKDTPCPGKKQQLCDLVRKDTARDAETYSALVQHDKLMSGQAGQEWQVVSKACGLNMADTTKSVCRTMTGKNYNTLSSYCPAEAKAYRVAMRKKECEGRSYTAKEDLSKCLKGDDSADAGGSDAGEPASRESKAKPSSKPAVDPVSEGAKKLKGLFHF